MGNLKLNHSVENGPASMLNPLDHEEFRRQGHMVIDFLADYYQNIEIYPVRSQVEPDFTDSDQGKSMRKGEKESYKRKIYGSNLVIQVMNKRDK
ncbi:hypothetical protein RJ639_027414 [Escallonia herrerae]|uniref:Uncharacterized protein n=1 Tax=Escallonia herrerae TaxID=1293975 RepID=A0AA88X4W8_9ASTE|nr:hypothetical protein RJ639_027414 [Escallonia herrerae]